MKNNNGFTLIEIMVSMGIAFVIFLVIYMAFGIGTGLFKSGEQTIQEGTGVKIFFERINDDLKFLTRLNNISTVDKVDNLLFEIFNVTSTVDPNTNDKMVQGKEIYYYTTKKKDKLDTEYLVLMKQVREYEWKEFFSHTQTILSDSNPDRDGYPSDMLDPTNGKKITKVNEEEEVIEQEENREFLLQSIKFIPYDGKGVEITGRDRLDYRNTRSIKIKIDYIVKRMYGEGKAQEERKTSSYNVNLVNLTIITQ